MKTEQVIEQSQWTLAYIRQQMETPAGKANAAMFKAWADREQAVVDGRLIHVRDDRWSWKAAFPVVGTYEIDGWKFLFLGHDERYGMPSNGLESWITARLVDFTRGAIYPSREGKCIECDASISAGSVELITPGGRKFSAHYRDKCGCRAGGPSPKEVGKSMEHHEAMELLLSYFAKGEEERTLLGEAASSWYKRESGSMGRLKEVIRTLGIAIR